MLLSRYLYFRLGIIVLLFLTLIQCNERKSFSETHRNVQNKSDQVVLLSTDSAFIHVPFSAVGLVRIIFEDSHSDNCSRKLLFTSEEDVQYTLILKEGVSEVQSGMEVALQGMLVAPRVIEVSAMKALSARKQLGGSGIHTLSVQGVRKIAVFLVEFADYPQLCTRGELTGLVWEGTYSVKNYFEKISRNKISIAKTLADGISVDIYGPYRVGV